MEYIKLAAGSTRPWQSRPWIYPVIFYEQFFSKKMDPLPTFILPSSTNMLFFPFLFIRIFTFKIDINISGLLIPQCSYASFWVFNNIWSRGYVVFPVCLNAMRKFRSNYFKHSSSQKELKRNLNIGINWIFHWSKLFPNKHLPVQSQQ